MVSLKLQKRLGEHPYRRGKVWLDQVTEISIANSQHRFGNIRKLIKDGFIIRKSTKIHSRSRPHVGRHSGYAEFLHNYAKSILGLRE
ncbi:hypothetical protein SAY86_008889 [Trapa natans]|uniref:Large ribosomal subunit protein eL19 domain-containing protein n=1 Tax=Trapa natans TaxID=22666 RepID=A0AAN7KAA0_TRANT|nr:hypothetical protein SAY86_008889 [Trapa natans]